MPILGNPGYKIFLKKKKALFRIRGKKIRRVRLGGGIAFGHNRDILPGHPFLAKGNPPGTVIKGNNVPVAEKNLRNILLDPGKGKFVFLSFMGKIVPDVSVKDVEIRGPGAVFIGQFLCPDRKDFNIFLILVDILIFRHNPSPERALETPHTIF
jgi:hypothetical protein